MSMKLAFVLAFAGLFPACITPSEKKGVKDDIYNVQTRLLNIEQGLADNNKEVKTTGDSASKRIASTGAELQRLQSELQRVRGELDALRVGVQTGQMPGSDLPDESSTAGRLAALTLRLDSVEASQSDILDAIAKAGGKKRTDAKKKEGADAAKKDGAGALKSADDLQKAFDQKQYTRVAEDAPTVVKAGAAGDKERARFLWAESLFKLGKVRDAALRYNDFLEAKPSKRFQPLAKMRLGDCFRHLGDGDTAKVYYEELIKEFPDSEEAVKAKERIAEIASGGAADRG